MLKCYFLERVWMVQTEQQYICIHQCLMAVLEGKENSGPQREIHDNQGYEGTKSFRIYTLLILIVIILTFEVFKKIKQTIITSIYALLLFPLKKIEKLNLFP